MRLFSTDRFDKFERFKLAEDATLRRLNHAPQARIGRHHRDCIPAGRISRNVSGLVFVRRDAIVGIVEGRQRRAAAETNYTRAEAQISRQLLVGRRLKDGAVTATESKPV